MLTAELNYRSTEDVPGIEASSQGSLLRLPLLSRKRIDQVTSQPVCQAATRTEIIRALIGTYNVHLSHFFHSVKNSHLNAKRHIPSSGKSEVAIPVKIGDEDMARGLVAVILPSLNILCSALRQSCGDDSLRRDLDEVIVNLRRFQEFLNPRRSELTTHDNPYSWYVLADTLDEMSQTLLTSDEVARQTHRLLKNVYAQSGAMASKKQS